MRLPDEPESQFQINIVPMIDVIFAILTFFIMSTLFLTRSQGLPVNLPKAGTTENQSQEQFVITIDPAGNLALNRAAMPLDTIEAQIKAEAATGQQPLVVINADTAVSHGNVVQVMDRLRAIDGVRLAIATEQP
ncbi:biopolymer transporter ExbD [Leptolyngbya sp. FACHB-711]|uniref:ExbD/TolR family protein n=1 Tax=unclassified Leptolyngbya TaxID=2650499 RepID=UPI001686E04D|nr:biopolymer transporter ExbD [Leptolyngbya sp. FACHB-711]MBD1848869.1 biopolymer transporter ExbD [Cyanobacteria bacterium FACHB-502]MBD2025314.1 biopolymer transporter ExbD [Leptolyngbya sp. FACHB-711]